MATSTLPSGDEMYHYIGNMGIEYNISVAGKSADLDCKNSPKAEFTRLAVKFFGWRGGDTAWNHHWERCFGEHYVYGRKYWYGKAKVCMLLAGLLQEMSALMTPSLTRLPRSPLQIRMHPPLLEASPTALRTWSPEFRSRMCWPSTPLPTSQAFPKAARAATPACGQLHGPAVWHQLQQAGCIAEAM